MGRWRRCDPPVEIPNGNISYRNKMTGIAYKQMIEKEETQRIILGRLANKKPFTFFNPTTWIPYFWLLSDIWNALEESSNAVVTVNCQMRLPGSHSAEKSLVLKTDAPYTNS